MADLDPYCNSFATASGNHENDTGRPNIRIFDTGGMLDRDGNGAMDGHANGIGLGDVLAAQLLSVSAFKPIIDKILAEGGFAAGQDALTSLTNALAAQQLASPAESPDVEYDDDDDDPVTLPATISGTGKATLGPKT
jgi:flotillin